MKKALLLSLFALLLAPSFVHAQVPIDIKINPIGALFRSPDLSAEFVLTDNIGIEPRLSYSWNTQNFLNPVDLTTEEFRATGLGVGVFARYYFNPEDACDKFYTSLYMRYLNRSFNSTVSDASISQNKFSGGLMLGYKWLSDGGISVDIGFGGGRAFTNNFTGSDGPFEDFDLSTIPLFNLDFVGVLAVGYRLNR